MESKLSINETLVENSRHHAHEIADGIGKHINDNTTSSVERTVARLLGIDGVDHVNIPLPNVVVEQVQQNDKLGYGIAYWLGNAMAVTKESPQKIAEAVDRGEYTLTELPQQDYAAIYRQVAPIAEKSLDQIRRKREARRELQNKYPPGLQPWKYVIVATGNVYEDAMQAKAAARQGADIIAVIRSTAQSLLDYVPYGATTEGFGGTYATQENFTIMRQELDEVSEELGRYIQLVNYCSGLCMPEIAALGAVERLDMMLNDAMYGILFRDINMKRTFVDQDFSRMLNAYAGIIINTGEDNYLTTADALEEGHTVMASQFINEELGLRAGLAPWQIGLGHAFEIDPSIEDGFLLELAQAQLTRQVFDHATLKYMPPTRYMTGDIFQGHLMNGMFNLASIMTGQNIQLLGMLTEAIHTPYLHDRALSLDNAKYIFNNARNLMTEVTYEKEGKIQRRAAEILEQTEGTLQEIADKGLMKAIEDGMFADISRSQQGGRGTEGVIAKQPGYYNPFLDLLRKELGLNETG